MKKECCDRKKVENVLKALGKEQLNVIIKEDKQAEIVCPYCHNFLFCNQYNLISYLDFHCSYPVFILSSASSSTFV